jgi:hypothetical protein
MPTATPDHLEFGLLSHLQTSTTRELHITGFAATAELTAAISPAGTHFHAVRIARTTTHVPMTQDEWPPNWKPGGHPGHPPNPIPTVPAVTDTDVDITTAVTVGPATDLIYRVTAVTADDAPCVAVSATLTLTDRGGAVVCQVPLNFTCAPFVWVDSPKVFLTQGEPNPLGVHLASSATGKKVIELTADIPAPPAVSPTPFLAVGSAPAVIPPHASTAVKLTALADAAHAPAGTDTTLTIRATGVSGGVPSTVPVAELPVSISPYVARPVGALLQGNSNYFFADGGNVLRGVKVGIDFTSDFVSSNGFSFQLNCYSQNAKAVTTLWQQYVIYLLRGSKTLLSRVDNWISTDPKKGEVVRADAVLYTMQSATIPAGSFLGITLAYDDNGNVTGANYEAVIAEVPPSGLHTSSLNIVDQTRWKDGSPTTSKPTAADLAPIVAFTFDIGGDINGHAATVTSAAGKVIYAATNALTVLPAEPDYTTFNTGTAESANLAFELLRPGHSTSITQTFAQSHAPIQVLNPVARRLPTPTPELLTAVHLREKSLLTPDVDPHGGTESVPAPIA